jgi:hypothetical protein
LPSEARFAPATARRAARDDARFNTKTRHISTQRSALRSAPGEQLELDGLVESVWVSIDAARPDTYAVVRRGGSLSV